MTGASTPASWPREATSRTHLYYVSDKPCKLVAVAFVTRFCEARETCQEISILMSSVWYGVLAGRHIYIY